MSRLEAEAIREEAKSKGIECKSIDINGSFLIELGESKRKHLYYWYAIMDLWELIYRKEGCVL